MKTRSSNMSHIGQLSLELRALEYTNCSHAFIMGECKRHPRPVGHFYSNLPRSIIGIGQSLH